MSEMLCVFNLRGPWVLKQPMPAQNVAGFHVSVNPHAFPPFESSANLGWWTDWLRTKWQTDSDCQTNREKSRL